MFQPRSNQETETTWIFRRVFNAENWLSTGEKTSWEAKIRTPKQPRDEQQQETSASAVSGRTEGRCGVTGVQGHLRKVESRWSDSVSPKAEWRGERAWSLLPSVAKFLQLFLSVTPSINSHHNSLGSGVYSQPLPAWSREVKGRAPSPHPVLCSEAQSCPTPCHPMDCSPPGSSVHGILLARILEWVGISSSRGSSRLRMEPGFSVVALNSVFKGGLFF